MEISDIDRDNRCEKEAERLIKTIDLENEKEFKKTEIILKVLERVIKYARKEKWYLNHLIEELKVDIKIWEEKYL